MSSMLMVPTTVQRYLKLPQAVEETVYGTTQNSATFFDMSVINSLKTTYANASEMYRKLGRPNDVQIHEDGYRPNLYYFLLPC